ncbi:MAG TPA: PAS domain-containing protein, partial [Clostridia bacterium]|nr:PAS domain-containing protein [Clostridia bacterium]
MHNFNFDMATVRSFYDDADFGFCVIKNQEEIIYANKNALHITGLAGKALRMTNFRDLFENKDEWEKILLAMTEDGEVSECSFKDNSMAKSSYILKFSKFGRIYSRVYIYDNTENSQLKSELMITEKRLTIAQKAADIGSWEYDIETGIFRTSEKANLIYGEPGLSLEVSFDVILEFIKDKERVKKEFLDFISGKEQYDTVYRIEVRGGTGEKVIYSYGNIVYDNSGKPIKAIGYIKDITPWIGREQNIIYEKGLINTYLDFVGTIIVMLDTDGNITFLNKKGTITLGCTLEDVLGVNWINTFIPDKDKKRISKVRQEIYDRKTDKWQTVENALLTMTGEERIIRWNNAVIRNEMGDVTGTISSGEDITDIRLSEKKLTDNEESLKRAEIKARMGHWIRKPQEGLLVWSEGLYRMFGYEVDELPATLENTLFVIHDDDKDKFTRLIKRAVENGESYEIELRGIKKDGDVINIKIEADVSVGDNGQTETIYGIVTDTTETYKRINELEEARNRLNRAEAMSKTGHWQRDLRTNTYIFSEELYRIFGLDEGIELITHELLHEKFHPEDSRRISEFTEEKLKSGEDYTFEGRILHDDGRVTFIEAQVQIEKDKSGKPVIANGIMRDVTDLKENERKLQENEFQLKRAEEISGTGNWVMDLETGNYICSDNFYKICGFDPESTEANFESIMSATHPDDMERISRIIEESSKTGSDYEFENRVLLPDGSIRHVRSKGTYIKDSNGKPIKSVGTLLDITEYKNTEERLKNSRERLEKAEEIAHVGHWERDFVTSRSYWSDEIYRILGCEPQSFEASEKRYADFIHKDDLGDFLEKSRQAHEGIIPYIIDARILDKEGNLKYIRSRGNTVKSGDKVIQTFGTLEDITEMRLREEELLEKNRMLDEAEAVAHVGHFINDYTKGTRYWSDEMFRILGYEPQCDIDKSTLYKGLMDPAEFKDTVDKMNEAIRSRKQTHEANFAIKDAFGNKKYLRHLYRFKYENGEHVTSFGVVQDMTELKSHYEDMEYMNYHDALTDLYNRRYFDEIFAELDSAVNYPLAVIIADINGLKMINDTLGHAAGDRLIMKTARILKSVAAEGDILARIGGDDFILLMPGTIRSQAEII